MESLFAINFIDNFFCNSYCKYHSMKYLFDCKAFSGFIVTFMIFTSCITLLCTISSIKSVCTCYKKNEKFQFYFFGSNMRYHDSNPLHLKLLLFQHICLRRTSILNGRKKLSCAAKNDLTRKRI